MKITNLNSKNIVTELKTATRPSLVFFYSDLSGPCRMVSKIIEQIAAEKKDLSVFKINIDNNKKTIDDFRLQNLPTIISFVKGTELRRREGYSGKNEILSLLD